MGLVALGIGVGIGVAAARNVPVVAQPALGIVLIAYVGGCLFAWFGSKRFHQSQWQLQIQQQQQDQKQAQQQAVNVYVGEGGRAAAQAVVGPPLETDHQLEASAQLGSDSPKLVGGSLDRPSLAADSSGSEPGYHQEPIPELAQLYGPTLEEAHGDQPIRPNHV